jgi:hypothetical protein
MSRQPDDNLISYTGDAEGNVWRNGLHLFCPPERDAETGGEAMRHATERNITLPDPATGRRIADTLKFSGVRNLTVTVEGMVPGGYEDCVDVNNRCQAVRIHAPDGFYPLGRYLATIKGGSRNIMLTGPVWSHGRVCDVDLGNLSDQSLEVTRAVSLNLAPTASGQPVTWRQLNAAEPIFLGPIGHYRRVWRLRGVFRWIFAHGARLLKRLGLPI